MISPAVMRSSQKSILSEGVCIMQNLPINISPTCSSIWHTPEEIRAAAVGGWVTAVTDSGAILQAWAGEFTVAA
jgi:hypothetical protein